MTDAYDEGSTYGIHSSSREFFTANPSSSSQKSDIYTFLDLRINQSKLLTVALALLIGFVLVVGVDVLGLSDPVQVSLQILLQLLLLTQLLEVPTSFGLLSLLGKLSAIANEYKSA